MALRREEPEARDAQRGINAVKRDQEQEIHSNAMHAASISHTEATITELRHDRVFTAEYMMSAIELLDDPEHRAVGLRALRDVAEAHGGLAAVALDADMTHEALCRALSPGGDPTLKALLAILHAAGMRLSAASADTTASHI